jgi:hypothetical protein
MEKYIFEYLTKNYKIETSSVGNYGIYQIHTNNFYPAPFNGDKLVNEVITVFGISKDEAHGYIRHWSQSICPGCNLDFYWKIADMPLLPISQAIAARTLGIDIVSVQPLSAPSGTLLYLDYVYKEPTYYEKIYDYFKNIYIKILGLFK